MPRSRRILVVEHETNARSALAELLRDEGFEVGTAADPFQALGELMSFAPDVVIADLQIAGIDDLELVRRLRQVANPPSVIAITAFGETAPALEALRAGARAYLTKPIHFDELLVVLDKVIDHHDLEREVALLRSGNRRTDHTNGKRTVS